MTKPRPILVEMPWNVKWSIADNLDASTLLSLRQVHKSFYKLLKEHPITYESVKLKMRKDHWEKRIKISLKVDEPVTKKLKKQFQLHKVPENEENQEKAEDDFINEAVSHLKKIFNQKNVTVKKLEFDLQHVNLRDLKKPFLLKIKNQFIDCPYQWKVQKFQLKLFGDQDDLLCILPFLQPKTLQSISFTSPHLPFGPRPFLQIDKIIELEQWKMAKWVEFANYLLVVPIERCLHLRCFFALLANFTVEDMMFIIENISETFNRFHFVCDDIEDRNFQNLLDQRFQRIPNAHYKFREWKVEIPDKPFHIKIVKGFKIIYIQKVLNKEKI